MLIEGVTHLVDIESPTLIWNNTANPGSGASDGNGGGLLINGQAIADVGGDYAGLGVISANHAKNGGGVAVQSGGGLRLFSAVAGIPALIAGNTADTMRSALRSPHAELSGLRHRGRLGLRS